MHSGMRERGREKGMDGENEEQLPREKKKEVRKKLGLTLY